MERKMNNVAKKASNTVLNSNLLPFIKDNGKYGIALLGLIYVTDIVRELAKEAMEKGYEVDIQAGKEKIGIKFTNPKCA